MRELLSQGHSVCKLTNDLMTQPFACLWEFTVQCIPPGRKEIDRIVVPAVRTTSNIRIAVRLSAHMLTCTPSEKHLSLRSIQRAEEAAVAWSQK